MWRYVEVCEVCEVCEVMIIWIIATYIPFGIFILRVSNNDAGASCVVCSGFAVKTL